MIEIQRKLLELHNDLLQLKKAENAISAKPLTEGGSIFIGADSSESFLVLFGDTTVKPSPAKRFRNLRIDFSTNYMLDIEGEFVTKSFTVLKLQAPESHLKNTFATVVASVIANLGTNPATEDVRQAVSKIIELFLDTPKVSRSSIVGLFGELLFIANAGDPNSAAAAWHVSPTAKTDFSFERFLVEIKTTESTDRIHNLKAGQLTHAGRQVFLASVQVFEDSNGQNLLELLEETLRSLSALNQQRSVEIFFKTIGLELEEFDNIRLSLIGGSSEILIFDTSVLPRPVLPDTNLAASISGISFDMNFSVLLSSGIEHSNLETFGI